MDHEPVLITTIAIGLTAAFVGGLIARRLRLPTIVGYIAAGIAIGPFTPGLIADAAVATELADIGVILLMFGVGLEFSIGDLMAVRRIAVPGALGHIAVVTLVGVAIGVALGWGIGGGVVLGLAIAIASTVVLLRTLIERNELDSPAGRIALGWLIVEDLFTVLALVLLPTVAPLLAGAAEPGTLGNVALEVGLAFVKAAVFAGIMLFVGTRIVPRVLLVVARERSRELFTLSILAIALGIAFAASSIFGISFALGAFLAGVVVSESDMSHQAAAEALPLRDAFAVLFFVSVGMLLDPTFLLAQPLLVAGITALIVFGKAVLKFLIVAAFGYPVRTALVVGVGLAQIGEFSFILATLGMSLALLPREGFQLVVAAALLSIAVNPLLFRLIDPLEHRVRERPRLRAAFDRAAGDMAALPARHAAALHGHAILAGYGRVGKMIRPALDRRGFRYVVISDDRREIDALRGRGVPAMYGDAASRELLEAAGISDARVVIVAVADMHASRLIAERAQQANPRVALVVRTHSDAHASGVVGLGRNVQAVHSERELAVQMARYALRRFGVSTAEAEAIAQGLRGRTGEAEEEAPVPIGERVRERVRDQVRARDERARARAAQGSPTRAAERSPTLVEPDRASPPATSSSGPRAEPFTDAEDPGAARY